MFQKSVRFGLGQHFDNGTAPSVVGMNNSNVIVEIHQTDNLFTTSLMLHVGTVAPNGVTWGSTLSHTNGTNPCVAINDNNFIMEVHEGAWGGGIYYSAGRVNSVDKTITWRTDGGHLLSNLNGTNPSVAINNTGLVILTYRSGSNLMYSVAQVDENQDGYSFSNPYLKISNMSTGNATPCVAMNNHGQFVITYQDSSENLCYFTGTLSSDGYSITPLFTGSGTFDAASSQSYLAGDKRREPSVGINDDGYVVITAYSPHGSGEPCAYNAQLTNGVLTFDTESPNIFDAGTISRVAVNRQFAVQVHFDGINAFWYSVSFFFDRANWMSSLGLGNRKLWQITFPATHDSCTYDFYDWSSSTGLINVSSACNGAPGVVVKENTCQAQAETILHQLRGGIRYIDIRPCKNSHENDDFYTYHYLIAVQVSGVLDQIAQFLAESTQELLIVNVSHFCSFTDNDHSNLIDLIISKLGNYMLTSQLSPSVAASVAYKQSLSYYLPTGSGSKVMLIYSDFAVDSNGYPDSNSSYVNYITRNPSGKNLNGFIPSLGIYDYYSKSNDYETMKADQLSKMRTQATPLPATNTIPTQLFLFSWTLTENWWNIVKNLVAVGDLHTLSAKANRNLGDVIYSDMLNSSKNATLYMINFIYVDYYNDARAVDFAYLFNQYNLNQF
jgi:hypothetical protein